MTKAQQLKNIKRSVDEVIKCSTECCICGEYDFEDGVSLEQYDNGLYMAGWRYSTSDKFQVEGIMCPECYETPDDKRGED